MKPGLDVIAPIFVPANRSERFKKAAASGADGIILDLEDAVAPEAKGLARSNLRADFTRLPVIVRVNGLGTPWHDEDVEVCLSLPIAAVMLPKAELTVAMQALCARLAQRSVPILALIETARGLADARALAATIGVKRLVFGSIDYCADTGCAHERDILLPARSELVLASRIAAITAPIDGVTTRLDDDALVDADARHASALGFGGKLVIHPRQVAGVKLGFKPLAAEVAWACKVLAGSEGAIKVHGAMVDEPVRIRARAILRRAE